MFEICIDGRVLGREVARRKIRRTSTGCAGSVVVPCLQNTRAIRNGAATATADGHGDVLCNCFLPGFSIDFVTVRPPATIFTLTRFLLSSKSCWVSPQVRGSAR